MLAEPLACAIHAIERADPAPEDALVISGVGALGAAAIAYVVAARPVRSLIAVVTSPWRASLARELGAHEAIDVRSSDAAAELRERFEGVGPDVYVDLSGDTASVDLGLDVVAPGGRLTLYGVYRHRASVDWNVVAEFKELEIRGGHLAPTEFGIALDLLARRAVDGRRLVTSRYALVDVDAALDEPRDEALKTILLPGMAAPAILAGGQAAQGGERTR